MIYFYLISASPQTLNPVGVSVSPYRIVRVVDKEGHITGIRESSDTTLECTRQVNLNRIKNCVISQIIVNANEDIHSELF